MRAGPAPHQLQHSGEWALHLALPRQHSGADPVQVSRPWDQERRDASSHLPCGEGKVTPYNRQVMERCHPMSPLTGRRDGTGGTRMGRPALEYVEERTLYLSEQNSRAGPCGWVRLGYSDGMRAGELVPLLAACCSG